MDVQTILAICGLLFTGLTFWLTFRRPSRPASTSHTLTQEFPGGPSAPQLPAPSPDSPLSDPTPGAAFRASGSEGRTPASNVIPSPAESGSIRGPDVSSGGRERDSQSSPPGGEATPRVGRNRRRSDISGTSRPIKQKILETPRMSGEATVIFDLAWDNARATCVPRAGKFLVLKGSTARTIEVPSLQDGARRMRTQLIKEGVLARKGGQDLFQFNRDQIFDTVSGAASVIAGSSLNGRRSWILRGTETTYGEWEDQQLDEDLDDELEGDALEADADTHLAASQVGDRPGSAASILLEAAERAIREGRLSTGKIVHSGHTRYLVHSKPIHKNQNPFFSPRRLSNGLFLETHCSIQQATNLAERLNDLQSEDEE